MMRLIRKDRSFFIFRKPEQNDIDLTNKTLQTKILTIDTGVFMKHYLENIDEVCRDVKTGVYGVSKFIGLLRWWRCTSHTVLLKSHYLGR